jgi:2-(1,2-epoxy-1,2-dihydrophenyl)acetyl-CoA isomerase
VGPESGRDEPAVTLDRIADSGVAVIGFTRPGKRNALRPAEWDRVGELIRGCRQDPSVRAVVITGHGGAFSAGFDLHWNEGNPAGSALPTVHRAILDIYRCPKPVVAAVEGCCVGAGWALALACDLVVAGRDAFFEPPFTARGLVPDAGIAWFLEQCLGRYETARLLWLDGRLTASQAAAKGLVTDVTGNHAALERATGLAARLAAHPGRSVAVAKATLRHAHGVSLETALDAEHVHVAHNAADDEVRQSRSSFVADLGRHAPAGQPGS